MAGTVPWKVHRVVPAACTAASAAWIMRGELSMPCTRPLPRARIEAICRSSTPSAPVSRDSDGEGAVRLCRRLTSAADVEDDIVRLRVQPLHDLPGQLGHEGGRVLVFLPPCKSVLAEAARRAWTCDVRLASDDQWSLFSSPILARQIDTQVYTTLRLGETIQADLSVFYNGRCRFEHCEPAQFPETSRAAAASCPQRPISEPPRSEPEQSLSEAGQSGHRCSGPLSSSAKSGPVVPRRRARHRHRSVYGVGFRRCE